jgi:hypothetical protein
MPGIDLPRWTTFTLNDSKTKHPTMKHSFHTLFLSAVALSLCLMAASGCKDTSSAGSTLYPDSRPYTRWWWFSSEIDPADVRDQLVWLKDHGFGGVEIAWVYPMFLKDDTPHPDFLSPGWSSSVSYAKRVADSLSLGCDFTFGTLWPFSDVDLPEGDGTRSYHDSVEVARRAYTWDHPKVARILNHLDREAFGRYAGKMDAALAEACKGRRSGFFVDSWEVETEYLWTPGFDKAFFEEHGYDITPYMEGKTLYDEANIDVKYDYMKTLSGYVMREFYIPFARNATSAGAFSRAQCGGAPTDLLTAFTLVDIPETEAILYEPSFSKIAASSATLSRKDAVTAETFTCMYGWTGLRYKDGHGQSPHQGHELIGDLKLVCDALFANGTNQIIWHGFPFNKVGRTDNWFYTTCQASTCDTCSLTGDALTGFNGYMTTVSSYMKKGCNYSDLAVYIPTEDAWMGGAYPESVTSMMPWALGEYEMRYIRTPEEFKGRQPLWVNGRFLADASYHDGILECGDASFRSLYVDVDHLSFESLESILRLAKEGLPVLMSRIPIEPGVRKDKRYDEMLMELNSLPNVSNQTRIIPGEPLLEGDSLPDFWCRVDGETLYIFLANPHSGKVSYPMEYGYYLKDAGCSREITVRHHGKSEICSLDFKPGESKLLKVTRDGITSVDLGYDPKWSGTPRD